MIVIKHKLIDQKYNWYKKTILWVWWWEKRNKDCWKRIKEDKKENNLMTFIQTYFFVDNICASY